MCRDTVVEDQVGQPLRAEDPASMVGFLLLKVPAVDVQLPAKLVAGEAALLQEPVIGQEKAVGHCSHKGVRLSAHSQ